MSNKTLYQKQTSLAIDNFGIGNTPMPSTFVQALGFVKASCAQANKDLELLDEETAEAIWQAATAVAQGEHYDQFPVDVFQTGSGTSTNMNANEVIASLASQSLSHTVHPNDDVNMGQSSNDIIPTTVHVSALWQSTTVLLPALDKLIEVIDSKANEFNHIIKTGRTHLMDAMPIKISQELSGWQAQLWLAKNRFTDTHARLSELAIGGTAVGTGINTHAEFGARVASSLTQQLGITFTVTNNHFAALSSQDTAVEFSGQLNALAVALMKISNDLRWMNSGPLAGLGEIELTKLQAGSSIMPGKVNPVIPEAVAMACAQVMGLHTANTVAGQSGNFQLNVMLPLIGYNLLTAIQLLANSCNHLASKAVSEMKVNKQQLEKVLAKNPILVTALNQYIGYEKGAQIAKEAYESGEDILTVAARMTEFSKEELKHILDPAKLVSPAG
ncbi:class II fumarate hydratase [Alteromonas sp. ASW11-130]|uniref:class II fumarate hydratase n=1 Tax=Alteromonas sp. ASW11-130 TaxID=3015775 RepID=UPI00224194F4|nr:class II fumarate hydratase [Alteromonas sp. ASW11-130]MCW8090272.1 class II fumarate hydratase [Alteromonas sp. ASW11-130]